MIGASGTGHFFPRSNGHRRCDVPRKYGPPKKLFNFWKRLGVMGILARMMAELAFVGAEERVVRNAVTDL